MVFTVAHAARITSNDYQPFENGLGLAANIKEGRFLTVLSKGNQPNGDCDPTVLLTQWKKEVESEVFTHSCCNDPVESMLDALQETQPNLITVGAQQRGGLTRLFTSCNSNALAINGPAPTIVFPEDSRNLVQPDGSVKIANVVVPVTDDASGRVAIAGAAWLADKIGATGVTFTQIYVGEKALSLPTPEREGWTWTRTDQSGKLSDALLSAGHSADLVVVATRGTDSLGDLFFGTTTERVLQRTEVPILVVPMKLGELSLGATPPA